MFERGIAIVALTKYGAATSTRIARALEKAQIQYTIYGPESVHADDVTPFSGDLTELLGKLFNRVDAIIAVMAVGIVVRSVATYVADKKSDPAVVVVDDLGKYCISLLSGHIRGANQLTKMVAAEIDAMPVVTTATELLGRKSVEQIAKEHDLRIVNPESLTPVNSAIVNDRSVLFATIGLAAPLEIEITPKALSNVNELKEMMEGYDAGIVIAPCIVPIENLTKPVAVLIPTSKYRSSSD
jgi:cobalt-precorrin 5A hydrolase